MQTFYFQLAWGQVIKQRGELSVIQWTTAYEFIYYFFFFVQHLRFQNVTAHFAHSYQAIMVMKTRYFTWTGQFTLPQRSLKL